MKVTNIKQQQKRSDRVSIFIDKKYAFSLSLVQLEDETLRVGDELSQTDVARLKKMSGFGKLYDRALQQLARRPRSEWEMRDYLRRKEATDEDIEKIISKLLSLNYLNDRDFADSWIRTRRALKRSSKRRLKQELIKKRIASDIIDAALADDDTEDTDVLTDIITAKRRQTRYQDDQKLTAYLVRQGFNYQEVREAMKSS